MHHKTGTDRNQVQMFSLEEKVEKEALVRVIDAFVDMLDLEAMGFNYYKLNKEGRPPFHPSTMMKIYLYGYQYGIRSCRRLEKACRTNIEMLWLVHEQHPHYKTIANFRKDNSESFKEVFRYFVAVLKDWNLIDGETIAIDSFKIRAQNSLKNNFNERKIKRHLDYIDGKIAEYELALDKEFDAQVSLKLEYNQKKKESYLNLKQQLKDSGDGQISTTDPDSKAVVFQRNSVKIGYNIQAATDSKHKLLIAADTGDVNDTKALAAMVERVQKNLIMESESMDVLADKGYHSGRELKASERLNANTFVSPKESSSVKKNPDYAMKSFEYNERHDTYTCPAGEILHTNGRWYNKKLLHGRKSYEVKHYKTKACKNCEQRSECTTNKLGRIIERTEYAEYVNRNNERVNNNPEYYRQRQQIIEHQFGTLKRHRHFDYTLLKGKVKVLGEVYLAFTGYNLGRSMSILGFPEIMRRIKAVYSRFISKSFYSGVMECLKKNILIITMNHQEASSHQILIF